MRSCCIKYKIAGQGRIFYTRGRRRRNQLFTAYIGIWYFRLVGLILVHHNYLFNINAKVNERIKYVKIVKK